MILVAATRSGIWRSPRAEAGVRILDKADVDPPQAISPLALYGGFHERQVLVTNNRIPKPGDVMHVIITGQSLWCDHPAVEHAKKAGRASARRSNEDKLSIGPWQ